ncbi:MAG: GGDEF domain-containing protein [Spirochaetaceae bacterium]
MDINRFDDIFGNSFFAGIDKSEFSEVDLSWFVEQKFSIGDMIIRQDTEGDVMYLISSGEVIISKVISSLEVELARRGPGDYVGEMALFDKELRSANVIAATNVVVYCITTKVFFELFNHFEQIKINVIKIINSNIRETGQKLGAKSISLNRQLSIKDIELNETRSLLNETIELKRNIDEQKEELELINRELEKRNKELYQLSIKDDLTLLYSKQHFMNLLDNESSRSKRYNIPLSLLIIDIDNFKQFNDSYGYFTGDRVIKETAGLISSLVRQEDIIGRIDGEKFGIILAHQTLEEAIKIADIIVNEIEGNHFVINGKKTGVTISLGISTGDDLVVKAEEALLKAKESGKNNFQIV